MSARKSMGTLSAATNRSGFHRFTNPARPRKRASESRFDILGGLMVIALSAGMMLLMRVILAN